MHGHVHRIAVIEADAVVRVRIIAHDSSNPESRYRAAVLTLWKNEFPTVNISDKLTFVRQNEPNEVEPYAVGQDFVIFLWWSPAKQVFARMSSGDGTVAAFAVENGRIHSAPISGYAGMEAEQLVNELASFAAR
jgi:hypothetical protein